MQIDRGADRRRRICRIRNVRPYDVCDIHCLVDLCDIMLSLFHAALITLRVFILIASALLSSQSDLIFEVQVECMILSVLI